MIRGIDDLVVPAVSGEESVPIRQDSEGCNPVDVQDSTDLPLKVRAQIRNRFRTFFERNGPFWASITGATAVRDVDSQMVAAGLQELQLYRKRVLEWQQKHDQELLSPDQLLVSGHNDNYAQQRADYEEYAAYVAQKALALLEKGNFVEAGKIFEQKPVNSNHKYHFSQHFLDERRDLIVRKRLAHVFMGRNAVTIVNSVIQMSFLKELTNDDLMLVNEQEMKNAGLAEEISDVCVDRLKAYLHCHPAAFAAIRGVFTRMGLVTPEKSLNDDRIVSERLRQLSVAMKAGMIAFAHVLNLFRKAGLPDLSPEQLDIFEKQVLANLVAYMHKDPEIYTEMCKYLLEKGVIADNTYDFEEIRSAFDKYYREILRKVYLGELDPMILHILAGRWRRLGLTGSEHGFTYRPRRVIDRFVERKISDHDKFVAGEVFAGKYEADQLLIRQKCLWATRLESFYDNYPQFRKQKFQRNSRL